MLHGCLAVSAKGVWMDIVCFPSSLAFLLCFFLDIFVGNYERMTDLVIGPSLVMLGSSRACQRLRTASDCRWRKHLCLPIGFRKVFTQLSQSHKSSTIQECVCVCVCVFARMRVCEWVSVCACVSFIRTDWDMENLWHSVGVLQEPRSQSDPLARNSVPCCCPHLAWTVLHDTQ